MAKSSYEGMSYEQLVAEKQKINTQIAELKETAREIARIMDTKQGEVKLKEMADKLSPEDKSKLKEML